MGWNAGGDKEDVGEGGCWSGVQQAERCTRPVEGINSMTIEIMVEEEEGGGGEGGGEVMQEKEEGGNVVMVIEVG